MSKLFAWLFLAAIAFGIAGLAVTTERASGQIDPGEIRSRFDIQCQQTVAPTADNGWKGEVTCSVTVDIPDRLTPPLPDTIKLNVVVTYEDVNQNGRPNRGDRLQCAVVDGPAGFHLERPPGCAG